MPTYSRGGIVIDVDLERLKHGTPASDWGKEAYSAIPIYAAQRDTPPALFKLAHETKQMLANPNSALSGIVTLTNLGDQTNSRDPLLCATPTWIFDFPSKGQTKETIVLTSGIHAREWYSQEIALLLVARLINMAATLNDPGNVQLSWWRKCGLRIVVMPIVNLFGYLFTLAGDAKAVQLITPQQDIDAEISNLEASSSRRAHHKVATGSAVCRGNRKVGPWLPDINRNFPVFWGEELGCSRNPLDDDYCGEEAASEAETRAVISLVNRYIPSLVVDLHSYGDDVLVAGGKNPSLLDQTKLSVKISNWLTTVAATMVLDKPSDYAPHFLYPCTGSLEDWVLVKTTSAMLTMELGCHDFAADYLEGQNRKMVIPENLVALFEFFCTHRPSK